MFLGIDTCTFYLNLALVDTDGSAVGEHREKVKTQTTRLVPALRDLLEKSGVRRTDIGAVGIVLGPGSFTGLRVGIAAAMGFGTALGIPLYGIGSLPALARSCGDPGEGMALLDARRSEVYLQRFRRTGDAVVSLSDPETLLPNMVLIDSAPEWAVGDGVPLVEGWPAGCRLYPEIPNLAVPAARRSAEAHSAGEKPAPVEALYVRDPDVRQGKG